MILEIPKLSPVFYNRFTGEALHVICKIGGTNRKMNASLSVLNGSLDFLTLTIVPKYRAIGEGSKKQNELKACYTKCPHHLDGSCYVVQFRELSTSHKKGSEELKKIDKVHYVKKGAFHLRCSSWGDIGILDDKGLDYVASLISQSNISLCYTSAYELDHMQDFKKVFLASVKTRQKRLDALSNSWKVYDSSDSTFQEFALDCKLFGFKAVKCMILGDGHISEKMKGCSVCKTPCGHSIYCVKSPNKEQIKESRKRLQYV